MSRRTHYDVLGVSPSASTATIREAYRGLAREHHPDRPGSAAGGRSMPEINEAYRVLHDPARRAVYDATLRTSSAAGPTAPVVDPEPTPQPAFHHGPARIPWRSLLFFGSLAIIGIVVLAQFVEPAEPARPDGILRIGDCVQIEANGFAREVACTGDTTADLVVEVLVPFDADCPVGTAPHQDRQGMGVACVAPPLAEPAPS